MDGLITFEKKLSRLSVNQILLSIWERKDVQELIIKLNTQGHGSSQLYEIGIDSIGRTLGEYTPNSIRLKREGSGDKRVDHITLKDTGKFYDSFRVFPFIHGWVIVANPITEDGTNLEDRFGGNIIGLSEESINILLKFIEPLFTQTTAAALS